MVIASKQLSVPGISLLRHHQLGFRSKWSTYSTNINRYHSTSKSTSWNAPVKIKSLKDITSIHASLLTHDLLYPIGGRITLKPDRDPQLKGNRDFVVCRYYPANHYVSQMRRSSLAMNFTTGNGAVGEANPELGRRMREMLEEQEQKIWEKLRKLNGVFHCHAFRMPETEQEWTSCFDHMIGCIDQIHPQHQLSEGITNVFTNRVNWEKLRDIHHLAAIPVPPSVERNLEITGQLKPIEKPTDMKGIKAELFSLYYKFDSNASSYHNNLSNFSISYYNSDHFISTFRATFDISIVVYFDPKLSMDYDQSKVYGFAHLRKKVTRLYKREIFRIHEKKAIARGVYTVFAKSIPVTEEEMAQFRNDLNMALENLGKSGVLSYQGNKETKLANEKVQWDVVQEAFKDLELEAYPETTQLRMRCEAGTMAEYYNNINSYSSVNKDANINDGYEDGQQKKEEEEVNTATVPNTTIHDEPTYQGLVDSFGDESIDRRLQTCTFLNSDFFEVSYQISNNSSKASILLFVNTEGRYLRLISLENNIMTSNNQIPLEDPTEELEEDELNEVFAKSLQNLHLRSRIPLVRPGHYLVKCLNMPYDREDMEQYDRDFDNFISSVSSSHNRGIASNSALVNLSNFDTTTAVTTHSIPLEIQLNDRLQNYTTSLKTKPLPSLNSQYFTVSYQHSILLTSSNRCRLYFTNTKGQMIYYAIFENSQVHTIGTPSSSSSSFSSHASNIDTKTPELFIEELKLLSEQLQGLDLMCGHYVIRCRNTVRHSKESMDRFKKDVKKVVEWSEINNAG